MNPPPNNRQYIDFIKNYAFLGDFFLHCLIPEKSIDSIEEYQHAGMKMPDAFSDKKVRVSLHNPGPYRRYPRGGHPGPENPAGT